MCSKARFEYARRTQKVSCERNRAHFVLYICPLVPSLPFRLLRHVFMTDAPSVLSFGLGGFPDELEPREYFWRDSQPWLEACRHMLPPRYRPGWVPSWKGVRPHETEISKMFSSAELSTDLRNHCVPVYDVLQAPEDDLVIIVMPLLRQCDDPPFDTVGEAIRFFQEMFEASLLRYSAKCVSTAHWIASSLVSSICA